MPKVVYIGPGTRNNNLVIEVEENEVDSLLKTKLWKKSQRQTTEEAEAKAAAEAAAAEEKAEKEAEEKAAAEAKKEKE